MSLKPSQPTLIVLPTYNESENIRKIIPAIHEVVDVDILVVDDNSPDGTGKIADEMAARDPRIHVLHRTVKDGLGRAYIAGFKWALQRGYGYIFEMDADFSHQPRYLPDFLRGIENADLVLGSRNIPGGATENWGLHRKFLSKGGSLYARTILGVSVRDLTGGFKCFRRAVLEAIDLDTVKSNGYSFQIELTYRTLQKGFRVVETPIVFVDREYGQSKMSRKIFLEAVQMVWKLRLGMK